MTREEAIETIRKNMPSDKSSPVYEALQTLIPELAESEDEKARKWIYDFIRNCPNESFEFYGGVGKKAVLAYLEKQRYDRMQPVYDNQESFESALDKAWKSYNDSGARTVDGCEDNYTECAYAKGFREGYLFGLEKQKEPENVSASTMVPSCWEVEQKEQNPYEPKNWPADKDNLTQEQQPEEHSAKGRRGRMGGIPECVRRKAEAFRNKMEHPYDADDICTAYEAGALESAKPAEWSEEDEKKIIFLERLIRYNVPEGQYGWTDGHKGGFVTKLEAISMLKSLRPSWKPREEQMKALCNAIAITGTCSSLDAVNTSLELESLREQLKKLM